MSDQCTYRQYILVTIGMLDKWASDMLPAKDAVEQERIDVYEQIADSMRLAVEAFEEVPA